MYVPAASVSLAATFTVIEVSPSAGVFAGPKTFSVITFWIAGQSGLGVSRSFISRLRRLPCVQLLQASAKFPRVMLFISASLVW